MKKFFLFLVWAVIFGMACDAFAIMVWVKEKSWNDHGSMLIYNDTDAYIYLDPDDDWDKDKGSVTEAPNPIGPYGYKMCKSWNIKHHDQQKGTLHVYIETTEGDKDSADDFKIQASNKDGETCFTLELPSDDNVPQWVFQEKKQDPNSGAWSIYDDTDDAGNVGQMYNDRYVVTFFADNYDDKDSFDYSGDTRIILLISKNGANRFDSGAVKSSTPDSWLD